MEQLREGLQEMRARCVRKEQEVVERNGEICDKEVVISNLEEKISRLVIDTKSDGEEKELSAEIQTLEAEREESRKHLNGLKAAHRDEIEALELEKETTRFQLTKKVKLLEDELEKAQDETATMAKHQGLLEQRLTQLNNQADYEGIISKLKQEVKRKVVLLQDANNTIEQKDADCANRMLVRQLKMQVEEAAEDMATSIRARKNLDLELADLSAQLEEVSSARASTEARFLEQVRENGQLCSRVAEQEEELGQLMKQYRASAASVDTYMITLQDQAVTIQGLEMDRDNAREAAAELRIRAAELEGAFRGAGEARERDRKEGELARRLEVEETSRRRAETRLARLSEELEEGERRRVEEEQRSKEAEVRHQKLVSELRRLGEDYAALQVDLSYKLIS